ncbi:restriction endonuclease subunit S [Ferrimonas aestuarii]|uniref:Restriction endonuclease subunit S n=1 Tax=Ferrimonas aestuarii TaxID=2569539 RepID=A0A4U1BXB1_9GAMM|nr:restriction endonuclease subunit S [Ferrimonas aestuarii]TKB58365.1 restriction endonuclease subunit S [Ferrimonas aestuarii]
MSFNWPKARLGDFCIKVGSGATPKGGSSVYLEAGEICLIRSQNIYNEGFKSNGLVYIDKESAQKLKNVVVEKDDVLINITGDSVARVCLAPTHYLPARVNQHVAIVRPDPEEFDPGFLRLQLASPQMQAVLLGLASAGATRNALTKGMLESLELDKPPIETQRAIGSFFGKIESKSELNNKANQTLEQMAQALFKSWFVDFDPVIDNALAAGNSIPEPLQQRAEARTALFSQDCASETSPPNAAPPTRLPAATRALFPDSFEEHPELGWIPAGWECRTLGDDLNIKHGFAFKGEYFSTEKTPDILVTPGNFKIGGGIKLDKLKYYSGPVSEDYVLESGDLVVTMTDLSKEADTLGYPALIPDAEDVRFLHNQRIGKIQVKDNHQILNYLYQYMRSHSYRSEVLSSFTGSTVKHTAPKKLMAIHRAYSLHVAKKFSLMVQPILDMHNYNLAENERLMQLRNTLLPKLLSGELTLPEATGNSHA